MDTITTIVGGILSIIYLIIPFIIVGKLTRIAKAIEENNTKRSFEASKILKGIGEIKSILSGSTSEE